MSQTLTWDEYTGLYDRLVRFAEGVARRHFPYDESQRQDAVYTALDRFVDNAGFKQVGDELVYDPQIEDIMAWGKTTIVNAIKNYRRDNQLLEPIPLPYKELSDDMIDGFHAYRIKE